jgi:hypothetical protein
MGNNSPPTESFAPAIPEAAEPSWLFSKELRALAWTTAIAVCAGIMHFFGATAESGRLSALSIYGFSRAAFNQEYVLEGAAAALAILAPVITVVVATMVASKFGRLLYRRLPFGFTRLLPTYKAEAG